MDTLNNDWQAQTCLITSWLDTFSTIESHATNSFVNYQNEFENHNLSLNNASSSSSTSCDFDGLFLDDVDLTGTIDMNSTEADHSTELNLIDFDLSDTKLFDLINEIEQITSPVSQEESSSDVSSPSTFTEISDSAYDSFSFSSSPASESDCGSISSSSNDKIKMIRTKKSVGSFSKKESNKAAASRYRSKKSKERDLLYVECELYEKKNYEMKQKITDIELEIQSIRSLLVQALLVKDHATLSRVSTQHLLA